MSSYKNIKELILELLNMHQREMQNKEALINEYRILINKSFNSIESIKPTYQITEQTRYFQPWRKNSYILNISLLIDENSNIGQVIKTRTESVIGINPFDPTKPGYSPGYRPHITLLKLYVKEGTDIDKNLISIDDRENYKSFQNLTTIIKQYFDDNLLNYSLDSKAGNYASFGSFVVRKYTDSKNIITIQAQHTKFINDIITLLIPDSFKESDIEFKSGPINSPDGTSKSHLYLTHYIQQKFKDKKYPPPKSSHSDLAIDSNYSSNWIPHVSLTKFDKDTVNPLLIISEYQKKSFDTEPMNPINLWSSSKKIEGISGSINGLYISYSHINPMVSLNYSPNSNIYI
jgi:hypothetical protein